MKSRQAKKILKRFPTTYYSISQLLTAIKVRSRKNPGFYELSAMVIARAICRIKNSPHLEGFEHVQKVSISFPGV